MRSESKYVNAIAIAILFLTVAGLFYSNIAAKKQDEVFASNQNTLDNAINLIEQTSYEEALDLLKDIEKENSDSVLLHYYKGIALSNLGDKSEAVSSYQKVLQLNPYLVEDAVFMFQYAQVLFENNENIAALEVLDRIKGLEELEETPDLKDRIVILQEEILKSL